MPDEMAREFEDRGVRFIGISIDGPRNQSKIRPFVQSLGVSYPIIRDMDSEVMSDGCNRCGPVQREAGYWEIVLTGR